ncbi:cytochrome P450 [Martensiomyces pterosporus]|nr:cytochrome P450 [Martensiomyces pterosporus]
MAVSQGLWLGYLAQLVAIVDKVGYAKIVATSAGVVAAYKLIHALYFSPLRNIPGPLLSRLTRKRAELIGALGGQAHNACEEYEKYGDIYVYQPNAVAISNPSDVRVVFGSHAFRKSDYYKGTDVLGVQTTTSARDPQLASMKRRQMGPYFNHAYLARLEQVVVELGFLAIKDKWDKLISESVDGQVEVNYQKDLLYATFDTIGVLAFGREFGALKNDDPTVSRWLGSTLAYFGMKSLFPLLEYSPFSLLIRPVKRQYEELLVYSAQCIADRKSLLASFGKDDANSDKKPIDLLQGFIDAEDPESKTRMTPTQVHAETLVMLLAGSETSSNTLTWTLHLLMLYPQHYRRAVEEARSLFDKDHLISFNEARSQLPFVEACIYESMRLAPVTGGMWPRLVPEGGVTLRGHFLPAGTEVYVSISGANIHKDYWNEPHLFDPTRFIDNEEAKRNVFTFSTGVRICPGKHLAWIEMLTILGNVLKDYDMQVPDGYTHLGPSVLDKNGYPKLMDSNHFITSNPANPARDCRILITKRA